MRTQGLPSPSVSREKVKSAATPEESQGSRSSARPKAHTQASTVTATAATAAHSQRLGALAMRVTRSKTLFCPPVMVVAQRNRSPGRGRAVMRATRVRP